MTGLIANYALYVNGVFFATMSREDDTLLDRLRSLNHQVELKPIQPCGHCKGTGWEEEGDKDNAA